MRKQVTVIKYSLMQSCMVENEVRRDEEIKLHIIPGEQTSFMW